MNRVSDACDKSGDCAKAIMVDRSNIHGGFIESSRTSIFPRTSQVDSGNLLLNRFRGFATHLSAALVQGIAESRLC
jgi:hypothetical protein